MVPRTIHFIWMQGLAAMPEAYRRCVESWAPLHPGWTVHVWSRDSLPPLRESWALDLPTTTFQCDVIRFELVYRMGGVYFDCDHECFAPIDGVVAGLERFVSKRNSTTVENSGFGAMPGDTWLAEVLQELRDNRRKLEHSFQTDIYWRRVVDQHPELHVFPWWVFQSSGGIQDRWKQPEEPAVLHHRYGLWTQERPEYAGTYGRRT